MLDYSKEIMLLQQTNRKITAEGGTLRLGVACLRSAQRICSPALPSRGKSRIAAFSFRDFESH